MRVMLDHCTPATTRHHLPDHQVSTAALMSWQGSSTREHRTGPRSSQPASLSPHNSLNRIGVASPPPQPVLGYKRRS